MKKAAYISLGIGVAACALYASGRFLLPQINNENPDGTLPAEADSAGLPLSTPSLSTYAAPFPALTPPAFSPARFGRKNEPAPAALPLVGASRTITVERADSLLRVAQTWNTDALTLARLNHLTVSAHGSLAGPNPKRFSLGTVRAGAHLLLPTRVILPLHPRNGVVLNIPERGLYVFEDGQLLARYPVAVGQPTWQTPAGRFRVVQLVKDPVWLPPREMVRREGTKPVKVLPGPDNPLGDRWIGWSAPQVGFHSTWIVGSVGQAASHGCVRMYPQDAHQLFDLVDVGTPIYAVYAPIKVGREGRQIFLSVSPDIYHKGLATLAQAQKCLRAAGLANPNAALLRRIAREQDGFPHLVGILSTLSDASLTARTTSAASSPPAPPNSDVFMNNSINHSMNAAINAADSLLRPTGMEDDTKQGQGNQRSAGGVTH